VIPKIAVIVLLLAPCAFAQNKEADSYCSYVTEQAKAEAIRLRTPSSEFGVTQQPIVGGIPQKFSGATHSISDAVKSVMTTREAKADCSLYRSTLDVQTRIIYTLPALEKEALAHRLGLISSASAELEKTIAQNKARVSSGNATIQSQYLLDSARAKMEVDRSSTELSASALYIPPLVEGRLADLAQIKQVDEVKKQRAIDKVNQQQNWNIQVAMGARKDAFPLFGGARSGAYGNLTVTYNLGSKASNKHLDAAENAWWDYKENQLSDANQEIAILKKTIEQSIAVREQEVMRLEAQDRTIEEHMTAVRDVDSSAAIGFRNQLLVDSLALRVELGDAQFRLEKLREYLAANF